MFAYPKYVIPQRGSVNTQENSDGSYVSIVSDKSDMPGSLNSGIVEDHSHSTSGTHLDASDPPSVIQSSKTN